MAIAIDREVRIPISPGDLGKTRERLRRRVIRDPVDPLIFPVGKINRARPDGIRPAAVFMHPSTGVESRRILVALLAVD